MSRPLIEIADVGEVTIVRFVDRKMIDMAVIDEVGNKLNDLVDALGRRNLIVSFRGVDYIASWMIGKLLWVHGRLKKVNGKLIVCEVGKDLHEVLDLTGFIRVVPVVADETTALGAFS
ncbi:MAG: STAS domain-containing protein [Gemmataceae bacterium]|jgi:anti-sigma B factor antagonist|nr:STAS domain-containing protein [Gemmataceae bacterium]